MNEEKNNPEHLNQIIGGKTVYQLFDDFIDSINKGKSYIKYGNNYHLNNFWKNELPKIKTYFLDNPFGSAKKARKGSKNKYDIKALELAEKLNQKEVDFLDIVSEQFINAKETTKIAFVNLLWLRYIPMTIITMIYQSDKIDYITPNIKEHFKNNFPFEVDNYSFLQQNIYDDLKYLSEMFISLFSEKKENSQIMGNNIKAQIIKYCNQNIAKSSEIRNILLHLCNPEEFEPIASGSTKEKFEL